MNWQSLTELGLNRNEAVIYCAVMENGPAIASELAKATQFHRKIVYENLERLMNRGLVSCILNKGVRTFQISSPDAIVTMIAGEEERLQKKRQLAETLRAQLRSIHRKNIPQRAELLIGKNSVRAFFEEALEKGSYVSFGAPEKSVTIMGEHFWDNHAVKRIERKIAVQLIFNQSLRDFGKRRRSRYTKIRYSKERFEPLTETHIQQDRVAIITWTEEPVLFLIIDKYVAASYRRYFETMWKEAKE